MPSIAAELASERLGRPVTEWIVEQRESGASWSLIVARLHSETRLAVSDVTLRNWLSAAGVAA